MQNKGLLDNGDKDYGILSGFCLGFPWLRWFVGSKVDMGSPDIRDTLFLESAK